MTRKKRRLKRDLVALVYPVNTCHILLESANRVDGLNICLDDDTWNFKKGSFEYGANIGKCNYWSPESKGYVYGVYDKTCLKHLRIMLEDAKEATGIRSRH